ncbi:heparan-alpha-glucosaminide N-acetyltransferase isoform X2 [Etheostoma cragini]|uniref:heparan-alpha-glucosaminide N-acetyltransferase isoform X2 n=1 Tax=Etheostoma cragini TaxID=417921 RepID=UPI00155E6259|nr:heparan-alpha-glucosaminide N-acetyltransferase isoform X2 [Etheostoma cragini]
MEPRRPLYASLTLLILVTSSQGGHSKSGPTLKMDQALLTFHNQLTEEMQVFYTSDSCYKCVYQRLVTVKPNNNNASAVISTKFPLTLQVERTRNVTLCSWSQTYGEGGHYSVWIQMSEAASNPSCTNAVDKRPNNVHLPLLVGALSLAVIALLFVVAPYIYRRSCTSKCIRTICCQGPQYSVDDDGAQACEVEHNTAKAKPTRLRSLDTFRGFALTVMVFVNYGGGGYWFFQHAPWNGLTVGDLVMPWFVFIIGTSVVLAFRSMQRRGVSRQQLLRKITWRTVVLLMLGFCFINYSPRDGPYFLGPERNPTESESLVETRPRCGPLLATVADNHPAGDSVALHHFAHACTQLPHVNPRIGYLGAGGIGDNGLYPNCTGGAAGYIDRWMFGDNMFRYPTCKEIYQTTQPFDPEGVLGTINSIAMGFLGMQAGKIIIFYRGANVRILCRFLVWAVILGISAAILSKCTRDGGFIPVNKNLWSLSYVMCTGCFSFLLLGGMYFVTDVKGWWGGQPFIYPGMNSIFVYVGHSLLGFYFPFSWEMRFQESHWEWLFQSLWATALWVLIAYLLYRKKFFLKI